MWACRVTSPMSKPCRALQRNRIIDHGYSDSLCQLISTGLMIIHGNAFLMYKYIIRPCCARPISYCLEVGDSGDRLIDGTCGLCFLFFKTHRCLWLSGQMTGSLKLMGSIVRVSLSLCLSGTPITSVSWTRWPTRKKRKKIFREKKTWTL